MTTTDRTVTAPPAVTVHAPGPAGLARPGATNAELDSGVGSSSATGTSGADTLFEVPARTPGAAGWEAATPGVRAPLVITVLGKPAPQGSKRHVGNGRMIESSKRLRPWREAVKDAAITALTARSMQVYGGVLQASLLRLDGPVVAEIAFCFDPPKSAPKRRRIWPTTRSSGDVDKQQRAIFDALTDAGVWRDDSQVVRVEADKFHTNDPASPLTVPGAVIAVYALPATTQGTP